MSGEGEFAGIFLSHGGTRPVMSKPPRMRASRAFVREVRDALNLADDEAEGAADWIADKMERFGAHFARPVFDMEGNGPQCSWCSMPWPLCGHHHLSAAIDDDEDDSEAVQP